MRSFTLFWITAVSSLAALASSCGAFVATLCSLRDSSLQLQMSTCDDASSQTRRICLYGGLGSIAALLVPQSSLAEDADFYSPKFVQEYEDFTKTKGGWSYRDVKDGKGDAQVQPGDRVVYDWSGYTIGYFGRPFQAKGGPQGGAFDKNVDYERTVIGSHSVVKGLEEAFVGMKPGGVRQVVVPFGGLSYPGDDLTHERIGPKPTTFSGQRALNFVLENPRVDRTLLFNVKVIRVDKPNGKGGFVRG